MFLQLEIRAYDMNTPEKYSDGRVIITMLRNQNIPIFERPGGYVANVEEDDASGKMVVNVTATDNDPLVCTYILSTVSPLQTTLGQSKTMNGRVHLSYSVLKGLTNFELCSDSAPFISRICKNSD